MIGAVRARPFLVLALVGSLAVVGCSDESQPMSTSPDTAVVPSTDTPTDVSKPADGTIPEDVTPSGVLLAATLIASGDVDDAVASGLVTPAEVDEAIAAIEAGTLDRWVALAEGK